MSIREIITALHGMGWGGLVLLAFSGALVEIYRLCTPERSAPLTSVEHKRLRAYLIVMAVVAWGAVLSGAYVVYPWYRARPTAVVTDYAEYAQRSLVANPTTAGWHNLGMEWKEHVAWFVPIAITMVAYVFTRLGADLAKHRQVRNTVLAFTVAAFFAAGIAGTLGALINKKAPVQGGAIVTLSGENK